MADYQERLVDMVDKEGLHVPTPLWGHAYEGGVTYNYGRNPAIPSTGGIFNCTKEKIYDTQ